MKKIYISGGITGVKNYKRKFKRAEKVLKKKGYDVVNPVTIGEAIDFPKNITAKRQYAIYMAYDIKALLDCDCIYMLDGWHNSKGATVEVTVAEACDIRIIYEGEA